MGRSLFLYAAVDLDYWFKEVISNRQLIKPDFVAEIWVRPMSGSATSTSSQSVSCMGRFHSNQCWNFSTIFGDKEPSRNRVIVPSRQSPYL